MKIVVTEKTEDEVKEENDTLFTTSNEITLIPSLSLFVMEDVARCQQ